MGVPKGLKTPPEGPGVVVGVLLPGTCDNVGVMIVPVGRVGDAVGLEDGEEMVGIGPEVGLLEHVAVFSDPPVHFAPRELPAGC